MARFKNGLTFTQNKKGQRVDEEGFMTSSFTKRCDVSYSCVSAKITREGVHVRNTNDKSKKTTSFTRREWKAFVEGVKNGEFDIK